MAQRYAIGALQCKARDEAIRICHAANQRP